jgi:hypothetical protein
LLSQFISIRSSTTSVKEATLFKDLRACFWAAVNRIVLVVLGTILRSGSTKEVNYKLKFLRPENPERTIKRAAVPIIIPKPAIRVIKLMALLLLLENK